MKEATQDSSALQDGSFMKRFLEEHRPPQEALDYFQTVPWLNRYLQSEKYKVIPTFSRHLKTSGEDYFFSRTINTPSTIPHFVSLRLKEFQTPALTDKDDTPEIARDHKRETVVPEFPDAVMLLKLGEHGVDGHPQLIHGGVSCAILDETMGLLIMLHHNEVHGPGPRDALFTANLNVSYRAPVPTPAEILVKTWLVKRQGRKWFSKGQITDKDGKVLVEADGLWVVASRQKL